MATSIKIDDKLKMRIQNLAEAKQRSAHWIMREAIQSYVEQEEKQEQLKQSLIKAWQDYQQTGQHLTQEEADKWLAKLEVSENPVPPPPKCHN